MKRTDIINRLIRHNGYKKYLEIGVFKRKTFDNIKIKNKDGVDPLGNCNFKMTSDVFFKQIDPGTIYDIVFIDGLHIKDQVLRDIDNSLMQLSKNGIIVVHDCNPKSKYMADPVWNGTVWEAIVELRMTRSDLDICVVDEDFGCGLIRVGHQELLIAADLSWEALDLNRKKYLNLISVSEFLERY